MILLAVGRDHGRRQRRDAVDRNRKSVCFHRVFDALSDEWGKVQSIGIPALREAGAARLGTWETMVFLWFSNVPWSAPGDSPGSRPRPREETAAGCSR